MSKTKYFIIDINYFGNFNLAALVLILKIFNK
jgi:hypothetical protein